VHIEYGAYFSNVKVLSPIETSMTAIAAILPQDVPMQVRWHMRGLLRNGGSEEQIVETLRISAAAVQLSSVVLKAGIPDVQSVMKERLF
jgi:alkylhydroperoxidase/carboxymuconolactone decarboxylase family protein YurZ